MVFDLRSERAKAVDKSKKAPIVDKEKWETDKNEFDLAGHDTVASDLPETASRPGGQTVSSLKIKQESEGFRLFGKKGSGKSSENVHEMFGSKKEAENEARELIGGSGDDRLSFENEEGNLLDAKLI